MKQFLALFALTLTLLTVTSYYSPARAEDHATTDKDHDAGYDSEHHGDSAGH